MPPALAGLISGTGLAALIRAGAGMGRRQGSEGIHRYTESQTLATQRLIRFAPMLGMSDQAYAKVMNANLRLMKKLGRA